MDLKIQGVPVHFPYKPYGCQLSMLNRVISALNNKQGCLIESPTGTGKTLALLCASLGWLEHQMGKNCGVQEKDVIHHSEGCKVLASNETADCEDFGEFAEDSALASCKCVATEAKPQEERREVTRIIYATRTHKQISQVIRELRKTKYSNVDMCILSSRKHSCINQDVRKQSNLNDACQNLKGTCPFDANKSRQNVVRRMRTLSRAGAWDLEDYVESMSKVPACPYFFAFKLLERASLCFCPYNYLLDPVFRETVASEISGSVIIIDEAHNIEDAARSATSVTLLEREVLAASEDLGRYLKLLSEAPPLGEAVVQEMADVRSLLRLLESIHQVMQLTRSRLVLAGEFASSAQVWSGSEIEGLLATVGLGVDRFESVRASFTRLNNKIQKEAAANRETSSKDGKVREPDSPTSITVRLFTYIFTMLKFMYNDNMRRMQDYRAVLMEVVDFERQQLREDLDSSNHSINRWLSKSRGASKTRLVERKSLSLNFWCLSAAVCMRSLAKNAHSLVLASGTLSPMEALVAELGLTFPVRLEASHVVSPRRVFAACVARGVVGTRLCATFSNQNAFVLQDDIGECLLQACKVVPGGVLCFFPSYSLMDKMCARWELTGLLNKLLEWKHILQEPRSSDKFDDWVAEFTEAVDSTRGSGGCSGRTGALALAVCRGKISEGLDFADDYGRLVFVIGIPFPAFKDPQIEQKRTFNDTLRAVGSTATNSPLAQLLKRPSERIPSVPQKSFSTSTCTSFSPSQTLPQKSFRNALLKSPIDAVRPPAPEAAASPRVLSGSEWYEAQAYRALNQALGRCIRHRNDWGAIVLAEARFVEQPQRYLTGVSRWLRHQLVAYERWSEMFHELKEFVERMTEEDKDV